ncbi:zinc finger protein 69 homolog B [Aethina tumida]|uniref:zinc finger protein 69 homolog B n=1 Tax=Aethina tumida TaxID=116153 RepID=UPI002147A469|nr:zinc finger protein 69 homolog B [Aethina tumida]
MAVNKNKCFTCLRGQEFKMVSIFACDFEEMSHWDKLVTCIPNVTKKEDMVICNICLKYLDTAYKFHILVLKNQQIWKSPELSKSKFSESPVIDSEMFKCEEELEQMMESTFTQSINEITNKNEDNFELFCNPKDVELEIDKFKNDDNKDIEIANPNSEKVVLPEFFTCNLCQTEFDKALKYKQHMKNIHSIEQKFLCTFCQKSYTKFYRLKEHLTIHNADKTYKCGTCDKSYQRRSSLNRHKKIHEIGKKSRKTPYLCNICGKSFPYSNGAKRHLRTHTGERKYQCSLCDKRFAQTTHLYVHMRVHTGEKPYVCDFCGDRFSFNSSFLKHLKHHQKNTSIAEMEPKNRQPVSSEDSSDLVN